MIDSAKVYPVSPDFRHTRMSVPDALLTQISSTAPFDALKFSDRDAELSWRDLAVASTFLQVALETSTVWSFPVERPRIPSTVSGTQNFYNNSADRVGNAEGNVVHVLNSAVPYDAIVPDQNLYNRDAILNEVIVRASKVLKGIDLSALFPTLVPTVAWSQAAGDESTAGIGLNKPLNASLFSEPDKNLAERDNQLAGYTARLVHALMNPFEVATRLLIEVTGTDPRSAEVYVLAEDTAVSRVWKAEPTLSNRMRVTYDKNFKTLRWVNESPLSTHLPQPVPITLNTTGTAVGTIAFAGISVGQQMTVHSYSPSTADVDHWRQKSGQISFPGSVELDGESFTTMTELQLASWGALAELSDVVVTLQSNMARFKLVRPTPGFTVPAGVYRMSVLVQPCNELSLFGTRSNSGILGDADGGINVPVGVSVPWTVTLPTGTWRARVEYSATSSGHFVFTGIASGNAAFSNTGGQLQVTGTAVSASAPGSGLTVTPITSGAYIRRIILTNQSSGEIVDYTLSAVFESSSVKYATASFCGKVNRFDVATFDFTLQSPLVEPIFDVVMSLMSASIPLRIKQLHIQAVQVQVPTPDTSGLEYWKYEMVNRAVNTVDDRYIALITGPRPEQVIPPPSDLFASRVEINVLNRATLVGSNASFTKEEGEPEHAGNPGGKSGWWKWTARAYGKVTLRSSGVLEEGVTNSGSSFDVLLAVYTGSSVDNLVPVASSGNGLLTFNASPGVEYQIAFDGYDGAYGAVAIEFEAEAPSNDNLANALSVTGYVRNVSFSTIGASAEVLENMHAGVSASKSAWISWSPQTAGAVTADVTASEFDARVAVYTGTSFPLTAEALVSSSPGKVTFNAASGTTYKIAIDSNGTAGNALVHVGPNFAPTGYWTSSSMSYWANTIKSVVPDFDSTFRLALPGDVGKPAIMPRGLEFVNGQVISNYSYEDVRAEVVVLQPWMISVGAYVSRREFWPSEVQLSVDELATSFPDVFVVSTSVSPVGSGTVEGGGSILEGSTVTLTAIPSDDVLTGYKPVDIIFLVDESGSMSTEHNWLKTTPSKLEAALLAQGIGTTLPNRYALAGFGSSVSGHGTGQRAHKHTVAGGDWGTAAQLEAAASGLVTTGGNEDGYDAIDLVFRAQPNGYALRTGAVVLVVLITDEHRTTVNSALTRDIIINELLATTDGRSTVFADACNLRIREATTNDLCIGRAGNIVYKQDGTTANYLVGVFGSIAAGAAPSGGVNSNVVAHYVYVAEAVLGTSWDLNILRDGGNAATAFTSAFVDNVRNQIVTASTWQFSHWLVNGMTMNAGYDTLTIYNLSQNYNIVAVFA